MSTLRENRDRVLARIQAACARAGRDPASIRLIWVSKNHPRESVLEALSLGARRFGENRVQEALEKFPLPDPAAYELHLIGRLQKNKVRKILPLASAIHSIDSVDLLRTVDRIAGELGLRRDVFLQVNTSREPQKGGFEPGELLPALESLPPLPHVRLAGLMTMGPMEGGPAEARPCFRELASLLAAVRARSASGAGTAGVDLSAMSLLSMGMTGDFEVAIEEGAHFLRVGTGLFGERTLPGPAGAAVPPGPN